jgi:hypothetical protein
MIASDGMLNRNPLEILECPEMLRDMVALTERTKQRSARLAFLSTVLAGDGHGLTKKHP